MTNLELINNLNPNIIKYNDNYYLVISNLLGYQNNPAYGIFVLIDDKLFEIDNDVQIFLHSLQNQTTDMISQILATGIEGEFELGKNYFISFSLWNYMMTFDNETIQTLLRNDNDDYRMQDYFDTQYNRINTNIYEDIEDTDLRYYYLMNKLIDFEFTLDELNNFVSTFCTIILDETTFTDITDTKNLIYKKVLEYYQGNGKDDTSIVLDLIFNSTILSNSSAASSCCNNLQSGTSSSMVNGVDLSSIIGTSSTSNIPCSEIYKNAMKLYLKKMLGDWEFYCDWFNITKGDGSISMPNLVMIEKLKKLFEQFRELGYTLYFGGNTSKCGCKDLKKANNNMLSDSEKNYSILGNYYNILLYAEDNIICDNKNKVKVYGENFGELLPYLYFV